MILPITVLLQPDDIRVDGLRPAPRLLPQSHHGLGALRQRNVIARARHDELALRQALDELGLDPGQWRDDPRLAELSYGQWEGFSWTEIEVHTPNALSDWRADPEGYCPPGGETHFELRRRSAAALADIVAANTRTVIVGHGVSGAVLRGINLGLDARAMFVLEKPQDAFFRLTQGREERIPAG